MWPLDARDLAAWWDRFDHAKRSYLNGHISRIEAIDALRNLRYRSDALKCEIRDRERERERIRKEREAERKQRYRQEQKDAQANATLSTSR